MDDPATLQEIRARQHELAMRDVALWSKVGDWIWMQYANGRLPDEVGRDLTDFAHELFRRWTGG